jgi:hypothetical protein
MDDLDLIGNPIWKHHQNNIDEGTYVRNEDGSVSTVYTTIMGDGEYEYLIPQVWDGKILEPEEAFQRAMDSGIDWPREPAGVEGVKRLERLDELLHENMVGFDKGGLVDEDRQTQEAFDATTGQAMALTPPRVEDQEADRTRRDTLTIESVPGFDRPMSASPDDEVVAQDELTGQLIYQTALGERYTISLNPDQRTARTRFEEDTLPAMQDYFENPTLPTVSQAVGFVGDVAQGAYETLEGAVQGRGTIGDVTGLAVGSGAGSMFGEVPEGSLRLFGGFRAARHPGQDAEGRELPRSVGADELDRFEIDDSFADFDINRVPQQSLSSLDNSVDGPKVLANPQDYFATLDQVLDHPELYRQYPEFRDLLVVEDTTIREGLGGYYNDKLNLLAVSPRIARDPNLFKGVLLHEVQHAIQKIEGFDRGTSTLSPEVSEIARPRLQEAQRKYDEALQNFESFDFEPALDDVKIFISELLDDIEADGLVAPEDITFSTPHRTGWEQNLNILADRLSEDRVSPLDSYETLLDFYALVRDNPNLVPDKDVFKDSFGVTPDDLVDSDVGSFLNSLESAEVIPVDPHRLKFLETDILRDVYRSRSGEVEARNVQKRLGLSLADRFNQTPESTEDPRYPRSEQWRVPREEPTEFNTGGVVSMEEQMSLFDMGGLTDDGAMRDPVSGNEVPPGSMASEVRDDVPAMLSEGEYIVPADVVRYYGVKFFEDLRGQAKSGMMDMEQNGRIGGEPVGAPEDDLTPEEMQMLAEITGMYAGGMVKGYQEGGVVDQPFTPIPNYNIPGFSLFQPTQTAAPVVPTQTQNVTLYGPNGEVVTLTLPTDQERYNQLLAQGYTTQPRAPTGVNVAAGGGSDSGTTAPTTPTTGGGRERDYQPLDPDDYNALLSDPIAFGNAALEGRDLSRILGGLGSFVLGPLGSVVGGGIGAGMTAQNVAQARAASQIAKAKGLDTTELDAQIESYIKGLPNLSRGATELLGAGDQMAERFFQTGRDLSLPGSQYGVSPFTRDFFAPGAAGDEAFKKEMEATAPPGMVYDPTVGAGDPTPTYNPETGKFEDRGETLPGGGYRRPEGESAAPTTPTVIPVQRPDRGSDSGSDRDSGGDRDTNVGNYGGDRDGDGVPNWRDFDDGVGWADKNKMAKGGLVSRRKKPVAKKK